MARTRVRRRRLVGRLRVGIFLGYFGALIPPLQLRLHPAEQVCYSQIMPETVNPESDLERAARVRASWFVELPDTREIVLLATHPRANYAWICSCGLHGTIASANHAFAVTECQGHLRGHVTPADPFDGIA
jgi:hypothetical protein